MASPETEARFGFWKQRDQPRAVRHKRPSEKVDDHRVGQTPPFAGQAEMRIALFQQSRFDVLSQRVARQILQIYLASQFFSKNKDNFRLKLLQLRLLKLQLYYDLLL